MNSLFFFKMRRILVPVTLLTCATPAESRNCTPICDGVMPLRASLHTDFSKSAPLTLNQVGGVRLYGRALFEIPLPLECKRPIF